jgi:hypothetical protein
MYFEAGKNHMCGLSFGACIGDSLVTRRHTTQDKNEYVYMHYALTIVSLTKDTMLAA